MTFGMLPRSLRLALAHPRLRSPLACNLVGSQARIERPSTVISRWYSDHPKVQSPALEALGNGESHTIVPKPNKLPSSIKRLNKQLATRQTPDLPEEELEERFVRGGSHWLQEDPQLRQKII